MLVWFSLQKFITLDFIGILLRLFQSLGLMNKNIHAVSSFHVYLDKLYEIEKNKELVYPENYVIDQSSNEDVAIEFQDVSFKYLGSDYYLFENLNLKFVKNHHTLITGLTVPVKAHFLEACNWNFLSRKRESYIPYKQNRVRKRKSYDFECFT